MNSLNGKKIYDFVFKVNVYAIRDFENIYENEIINFIAQKEEIVMDDSIEYISNGDYSDYINLKKLTLGKNVKNIFYAPFRNCFKLQEIVIPNNKRFYMDGSCLIKRNSKTLVLGLGNRRMPDNVKNLEISCFLKEGEEENFYIGKSFTSFINTKNCGTFRNFNIKNIELNKENEFFELENDCLFYKNTNTLVLGCEKSVIPERTEEILAGAFSSTNIKKIHIPNNVKTIKDFAFCDCEMLEEVTFGENLKTIDRCAFANTKIKKIHIPKKVWEISLGVFKFCEMLEEVTFEEGLFRIDYNAFAHTNIKEVILPKKVDCILEGAFLNCKNLENINIKNVRKVSENAFLGCEKLPKKTIKLISKKSS